MHEHAHGRGRVGRLDVQGRKQVGEARRVGLQLLVLLGRALADHRELAARERAAEEAGERAVRLPRLADPTPRVQVVGPQHDRLGVGLLEQLDAALLPLPEVAHAGDDAAPADLPDVVDAVEVLVADPAVGLEQVGDQAVQQDGLADARWADQQDRRLAAATHELPQLLAVRLSDHAEPELVGDGLAREVEAELAEQRGAGPPPPRADAGHLGPAAGVRQEVEDRLRLAAERDHAQRLGPL